MPPPSTALRAGFDRMGHFIGMAHRCGGVERLFGAVGELGWKMYGTWGVVMKRIVHNPVDDSGRLVEDKPHRPRHMGGDDD